MNRFVVLMMSGLLAALTPAKSAETSDATGSNRAALISTELTAGEIAFLKAANETALTQEAIAALVAKHSSRQEVAQFAESVRQQLLRELKQLREIAGHQGLRLNDQPDEQQKPSPGLDDLKSPELDAAFLNQLISSRGGQISALEQAAGSTTPEIQAFALHTIKAITDELRFIQQLSEGKKEEKGEPSPAPAATAEAATPGPSPPAP